MIKDCRLRIEDGRFIQYLDLIVKHPAKLPWSLVGLVDYVRVLALIAYDIFYYWEKIISWKMLLY